ncbi:MAG TPA: hypothetical protein DCZ40_00415 [Lachnospiraceae bacterium]|nr:hypothetical protein [Lachnospiraceae bacterium]
MIHDKKKVAKIVEELTLFFFALGADKIQSEIEKKEKEVVITFQADCSQGDAHKIAQMEKYLNCPKNDGMKEVYWELAGAGQPGDASQLLVVGMMIDRAQIKTEDGMVYLKLYKEQQE